MELPVGATYYREFTFVTPSGANVGQPANADFTPTIELRINGSIDETPPTITVANIETGRYSITFLIDGSFTIGTAVVVYVDFTYQGTLYRRSMGEFTVTPQPLGSLGSSPVVSAQAMYNIFGTNNINKWADVDDDGNMYTITSRIAWAANRAMLELLGRLSKRYSSAQLLANIPPLVVELICSKAGVILYRSPRGLVDGNDENAQIKSIDDDCEDKIAQILAGRIVLINSTDVTEPTSVPRSIKDGRWVSPYWGVVQHDQDYCVGPDSMWYNPNILPESLWYQTD